MRDRISEARRHLSEASRHADSQLQTQLRSLDKRLGTVTVTNTEEATHAERTHRGRVLHIEEKLVNLPEKAEGQTRLHIKYAMRLVVEYRRTHDFEG
jgi:hypothetical protein